MALIRFVKLATCLATAALTLASENELHDSSIESSSLLGRSEQIILDNTNLSNDDTTAHGRACQIACTHLSTTTSIATAQRNTSSYSAQQSGYWSSFQSDVSPACFAQPSSAEDVAQILSVARQYSCPFAVRSGGHAAFAGASSIEAGITISLTNLKGLALSDDETLTRVGPGNKWLDVYNYLQPRGRAVVGGRVPDVGTGGLVLGGGISFFSSRYGFACDGVRNYELVVADGAILQVNASSYPDLFWALRGGGNNFGIVTRLDLETFPQGEMWGGSMTVLVDDGSRSQLVQALEAFAHRAPEDLDAHAYEAFVYVQSQDSYVAVSELTHAAGVAEPAIFENFTRIPHVASTLRKANLTDLVQEVGAMNVNGLRESYSTRTFKADGETMDACLSIFMSEVLAIKTVAGILPVMVFQPFPTSMIKHSSQNGGNSLGIEEDAGPLLLMSTSTWWADPSQDELVLGTMENVVGLCAEKAEEMGTSHPYIYQNYASRAQEVFGGYGEENLQRLRAISEKWDAEGVFQKLQPGYFKLWE